MKVNLLKRRSNSASAEVMTIRDAGGGASFRQPITLKTIEIKFNLKFIKLQIRPKMSLKDQGSQ